jgi:DNA-binding MarR family transcriptional regulator
VQTTSGESEAADAAEGILESLERLDIRERPAAHRPRARGAQASGASPRELAGDLIALATYVFKESSDDYYRLVAELDLSLTQLRLLATLARREDEIALGELAELTSVSLAAASRTVESLLQRGYIVRRECERDRRVKRVRLSAAGRALVDAINAARMAGTEQFAATLDEQERARLRDALASLLARPEIAACRPPETAT